jgi:hypothetical protein
VCWQAEGIRRIGLLGYSFDPLEHLTVVLRVSQPLNNVRD